MPDLFDMKARAQRRDRAARVGPELFLYERAFEDCLERLSLIRPHFDRALLIGCPDNNWRQRLRSVAGDIDVVDPGPLFAKAASGHVVIEDHWLPSEDAFDLVLTIGTMDTVNELPRALRLIRRAVASEGLFMGAISGGDTLPHLRTAMRAADAASVAAAPHVHPRIEASALAPLLAAAGFANPVVDVDRIEVSYPSLERLIYDLRSMGTTNVLAGRPRNLTKAARAAAFDAFDALGDNGRTIETFEILHFVAWASK